jgi:hypothetical protein
MLMFPTSTLERIHSLVQRHGYPGGVILSAAIEFSARNLPSSFIDQFVRQHLEISDPHAGPKQLIPFQKGYDPRRSSWRSRAATVPQEVS